MKSLFLFIFYLFSTGLVIFAQSIEAIRVGPKQDLVTSLVFSPDGKLLASTNKNHQINIWETEKYQMQQTFSGHTDKVLALSFDPAGQWLVSGSSDKTAKIWEVVSGKAIRTLPAHTKEVTAVAYSFDGKWIATGSADHSVKVWNAQSGKMVSEFTGHRGQITTLTFSRDHRFVISGSGDHTIRIWDIQNQKLHKLLAGHRNWIRSIKASPDSVHLASGGDDRKILIWNIPDASQLSLEKEVKKSHTNWIVALDYHTSGKFLLSGSHDSYISIVNTTSTIPDWTIDENSLHVQYRNRFNRQTGRHYLSALAFKPVTYQIVVGTLGKGIYLIDYYQHLFKMAHQVTLTEINNKKFETSPQQFQTSFSRLNIKGSVTRGNYISKAVLTLYSPENTVIQEMEIGVSKKGNFSINTDLVVGVNRFEIKIRDVDPQINQSVFQFSVERL
jgi:WD40 repeat protein